jgi:serine/threonine protein phosphatase PrpC
MMGRVNGGLNLTRSFGDFDYKSNKSLSYFEQMITCKPDIREIKKDASDEFIVVGCDGIWEKYVEYSQGLLDVVREHLKKSKDHKEAMEGLLEQLLAKDTREGIGCDNMTAIIITFK